MIYPNAPVYIIIREKWKIDAISAVEHWQNIRDAQEKKNQPNYIVIDTASIPKDGFSYFVMKYNDESNRINFVTCVTTNIDHAKDYFKRIVPGARERKLTDLTQRMEEMICLDEYLPRLNNSEIRDRLIELQIDNPAKEYWKNLQNKLL